MPSRHWRRRRVQSSQLFGQGRAGGGTAPVKIQEVREQEVGRLILAASVALGTEGRIDGVDGIERLVLTWRMLTN
jgi:hypothetical protein